MTVRGSALAVQRNDLESQRLDPHAAALIVIVPAGRTRCRPRLAGLLRVPPRHDEVAGLPHCGAQELEALEALRLVDSLRTIGEAALDLLLSTLREGQRSDRGGPIRKLGLVGGTGPESTISYYRTLTQGVQNAVGVGQLPPLVIDSLSVFDVLDLCARDDMDGLLAYLSSSIDRLAAAGAEVATLTALTPHIVFDRLRDASPIPLISAVEATRDEALARNVSAVALLGTEPTMTGDFFAQPLRDAGIDVAIPDAKEIAFIQDRIVRELEQGIVTDATREGFVSIIERLRADRSVDSVVLGCTELPLLLDDTSSTVPCLDPVEIHSRALIAAIVDQ